MKDEAGCKNLIRVHEGLAYETYLCSQNKKTIGIGFNLEKPGAKELIESLTDDSGKALNYNDVLNKVTKLTRDHIEILFNYDFKQAISDASNFCPIFSDLDIPRQHVLVDMAFNLGLSKLNGFVKFKEALLSRNFEQAAEEMQNSKWYTQVGRRGRENVDLMKRPLQPVNSNFFELLSSGAQNACGEKFTL